ncbi:MAG: GNAT family N-acetyltransferase [Pseudomonadota bacterium]
MQSIKLSRVYSMEMDTLREYIEALYKHDEDFEAMINIEEGVKSLLRNESLATPYFIQMGEERVGYVILTRYHSVEKGGLTIYIDELYVEDRYRKKGIGGKVMEEIMQLARTLGAKTLWAQTETYNKAAQSFFKGNGFRQNSYLNFERPL